MRIHDQRTNRQKGCFSLCRLAIVTLILGGLAAGCAPKSGQRTFNPRDCMDYVPAAVSGLVIETGPRSKTSIIRDMVPAYCNGQVLFQKMTAKDPSLKPGRIVFRVVVEYTGEVLSVEVEETTIESHHFTRRVADFIMDTDFISWAPSDTDTVFHYPVRFGL
jgi:hypothetical protein